MCQHCSHDLRGLRSEPRSCPALSAGPASVGSAHPGGSGVCFASTHSRACCPAFWGSSGCPVRMCGGPPLPCPGCRLPWLSAALAIGCPAGPLPSERLSSSLPFRGEELRLQEELDQLTASQAPPLQKWHGGEAMGPSTHRRLQTQTSLMGPIHIRGG